MTPDAFKAWLAEMKSAGLARSDAECARQLGVSPMFVSRAKRDGVSSVNGTDVRTALACRALLHRLRPYGER